MDFIFSILVFLEDSLGFIFEKIVLGFEIYVVVLETRNHPTGSNPLN